MDKAASVASRLAQRCWSHQPLQLLKAAPVIAQRVQAAPPGCSEGRQRCPAPGCHRHPVCQQSPLEPGPHQGRQHPRRQRQPNPRSAACNRPQTTPADGRSAHTARRGGGGALQPWAASSVAAHAPPPGLQGRWSANGVASPGAAADRFPVAGLHPRRRCAGPSDAGQRSAAPLPCQGLEQPGLSPKRHR